jgi:copper chaperone CopZ
LVQNAPVSADLEAGKSELSMEIIELMCSPCAAQIVSHSRQLPGVTKVSMVLATKTLIVQFDPGLTGRDAIVAAVEDIVANIQ